MADKTVIVKIEYDTDEAVKSVENLTSTIEGEKVMQAKLKDELEKGTISQKEYSTEIEKSKQVSSKANTERKSTVQLLNAEKGSVNELKANIKQLEIQNSKLNLTTKKGTDELKRNNDKINELKGSLKAAKTETGKTSGAFSKFGNNLQTIPGPMGGIISGIVGMTKAAIAFIATGIGAIIAVLGLALGALIKYFKGSEEGQNALNKVMLVFKTIIGNLSDIVQKFGKTLVDAFNSPKEAIKELGDLIDRQIKNRLEALKNMGGAIAKIFSKDWKDGFKDLGSSFVDFQTGVLNTIDKAKNKMGELTDEMKREIAIAKMLADRQAALDLVQRKFLVEREKLEAQIAEARVKAVNKEQYSAEERVKFLQEALDTELLILDTNFKITKEKFELKKQQNALSNSTKEDLNEQAQLEADMYRVQRENATKRMSLTSQLSAAQKEINNEIKKQGEASTGANLEDEKAQAEILKRRGIAITKLAELKQQELEADAKNYEEKRSVQIENANQDLELKLEQKGILDEEIELAEIEHRARLEVIEAEYQANIKAQREQALQESFNSMQQIIGAAEGMADKRVTVMSDAFSKISTINFKEIKSSKDAFIQIGSAAKGLTSLITKGYENELSDLEVKRAKEIELAGDNVALQEDINRKYNKKAVELKRKQFREDKLKASIDAGIATALAIAKSLPNIPLSILSGILGGAQIAAIASKKEPNFTSDQVFAKGGVIGGKPHSQGGTSFFGTDGSVFNTEKGEAMFVLNKDASSEISALSTINESHGGRSFSSKPSSHLQDGGEVSTINIEKSIQNSLRQTPIIVKVSDIETGLTDYNNVKQAGTV